MTLLKHILTYEKKLRQRLLIFSEKSSSCQMISHLKKYFICRFFFCFTCAGGGWSGQSVEVAVSLEVRKMWQVSQACVGKEITISQLRLGISSVQELYLFGSDNKHINDGKAYSIHKSSDWLTDWLTDSCQGVTIARHWWRNTLRGCTQSPHSDLYAGARVRRQPNIPTKTNWWPRCVNPQEIKIKHFVMHFFLLSIVRKCSCKEEDPSFPWLAILYCLGFVFWINSAERCQPKSVSQWWSMDSSRLNIYHKLGGQ